MILIVTAINLSQEDIRLINVAVEPEKIEIIWVGKKLTTNIEYDLKVDSVKNMDKAIKAANNLLIEKGTFKS